MTETSKKRSRRVRDSAARRNQNHCTALMATKTKRPNRNLLSAAVLTLATLAITIDTTAVVAFTPNSGSQGSLSTGPVTSSSIENKNNKDSFALKIPPMSTRRRQRHQTGPVSSTVVDDDSANTATTLEASASSPILQQQRRSQNVVVLDEEYFHSDKKKELAVQVLFKNEIVNKPLRSKTPTGSIASPDTKRTVRPQRKKVLSRKKSQSKSGRKIKSGASASSSLLTRDEERQITNKIRALRRLVHIRDELIEENESCSLFEPSFSDDHDCYPTEEEWAKACELDTSSLRTVMSEGKEARSLLVSANAGLVKHIAKRHYYVLKRMTTAAGGVGTILTLQDMIQEGNLGLMKAAERFEPERGFRFSTYATYWIRQRILQSITDSSRVIRLPVHVTETLKKVNKARKELSAHLGRMPSDDELANFMNISVDKLRKISDKTRAVVSLESPISMGSNHRSEMDQRTIGDSIASDAPTPEEDAEHKLLQQDIRAVVNQLAEREREVLILRFGLDNGEPMSTSETAAHIGITTDRVRHVETRALNKLRNPQRNYRLKDYLGEGHIEAVEEDQRRKLSTPTAAKSKPASRNSDESKMRKKPSAQEKFWFF